MYLYPNKRGSACKEHTERALCKGIFAPSQMPSFSFIDLYREVKHIRLGKLITAVPVAPEVEKRLRTLREYSNNANIEHLEFETNVDPSLIGGFIFQVGSNRIDASIAGQLKRVKKQFIEKNRRIV